MRTFERIFGSIHPNIKKVIDMNFSTLMRYYTDHDWIRDEWFYHTQVLTKTLQSYIIENKANSRYWLPVMYGH